MGRATERRDALAEELDARGWTVLDTFDGFAGSPAMALRVESLDVAGETFESVDVTVTVRDADVSIDRVEVSDERTALSEAKRDLLDSVSTDKLAGADVSVWEYNPGSRRDSVDALLADLREVYAEVAPRPN